MSSKTRLLLHASQRTSFDKRFLRRPGVPLPKPRDFEAACADQKVASNLAVWYQQKDTKEGAGSKGLADLRQWWRRSGREQSLPIDGVSGATRPVGQHQLRFESDKPPLASLKPGSYQLVVEAVREVGGRELLKIPFDWPISETRHLDAKGQHELGQITLDLNP